MLLLLLLLPGVFGDYCSQFSTCESCSGRHRVTFEVCHWCPDSNSCVPASAQCRAAYRTVFDCPRISTTSYNDSFARLVATPIIAAAQGTHDQMNQCLQQIDGKIQLWRRFYVQSEDGTERSDGFVAVDFTRRAVIVSFSSVASGAKLLYNRFSAEFFTNRQAQFEASNGLVNRLIYDSWFKLWYVLGMESTLKQLFRSHPDFELWLFGHAIGGAKADMTAVAVGLKNMTSTEKIKLMTFGATRVGDLSFVEMIETTVSDRFRIIHRNDMATRFPKEFEGEWTPPHHHRYEVWYPQSMEVGASFIVCLGAEDPQCSSQLYPWQLRAEDNDVYFERHMEQWALSGCDKNDRTSKVGNSKFKPPTVPPPVYNMAALRTAKPYATTEAPHSLPPTQPTPSITLPPKHLRPLESDIQETSTLPQTTTSMMTTTTRQIYTLPWWYTTQPWSSTTPVATTTRALKEWDDGKIIETMETGATSASATTTSWPPSFRGSFRGHTFRFFEKGQKFRPFTSATRKTTMVEGEGSDDFQKAVEIEPRAWSSRISKDQKRKWAQFEKNSKSRTAPEGEAFLTVVDREAEQVVSWDGQNIRKSPWKVNSRKSLEGTQGTRPHPVVEHLKQ